MMRVYVASSLWVGEQEECLLRCMDSWALSGLDVTFTLDANRECAFSAHGLEAIVYVNPDETRGTYLQTWNHRRRMIDRQDEYDLFVYHENDILLTREHVDLFLDWTRCIPKEWSIRFMNFVYDENGKKRIYHTCPADGWDVLEHQGQWYLDLHPRYWASFMLTRKQLKTAIQAGGFTTMARRCLELPVTFGVSEDACAEPWLKGVFLPVLPVYELEDFLVEHLSGKYVEKGMLYQEILERTRNEVCRKRCVST